MGAEKDLIPYIEPAMRGRSIPQHQWNVDGGNPWNPDNVIQGKGSSNIRMLRNTCKMASELEYGGKVKNETWEALLGLCKLPIYNSEPAAGNQYGYWHDWNVEYARLMAQRHGRNDVYEALTRRQNALLTLVALCSVPVSSRSASPHPTPWGELKMEARNFGLYACAYPGLCRGYTSGKDSDGHYKTDGRWNRITVMEKQPHGRMLAMVLGDGSVDNLDDKPKSWIKAMNANFGKGKAFHLPADLKSLLTRVVRSPESLSKADWETVAETLSWGAGVSDIKVPIECGILEDGTRWLLGKKSTNNGSTNWCPAIVVRRDGYRQWAGMSIPMRQQEGGVTIEAEFWTDRGSNQHITSRITNGVPKGDHHDRWVIDLGKSPVVARIEMNSEGGKIVQLGTVKPPIDPPPIDPPPTTDEIDLIDILCPAPSFGMEEDGGTSKPAWTVNDRAAGSVAHIKHPNGTAADFDWYDKDSYHLWITPDGDWDNPSRFKHHVPGWFISWPRFFKDSDLPITRSGLDTSFRQTADCIDGPVMNVGTGQTRLKGPYTAGKLGVDGGDIHQSDIAYKMEWIWQGGERLEVYTNVVGFGRVRWQLFDLIDGSWVLSAWSPTRNIVTGKPTPEYANPCLDLPKEIARMKQAKADGGGGPIDPPSEKSGCGVSLALIGVALTGIVGCLTVIVKLITGG